SDRTPVIKLLVEHGASLAALDQHGLSPVHYAARQNNLETLGFLMSKIDALPPQVSGQMSVLHYLCSNGNSVALEQLLASPKCDQLALTKSASGDTPLHLAAWFGHRDCVALLVAHLKKNHPEADIEASCTNFAKATPAHFAAYRGNTEVLQLLNQAGFHMDAKDEEASTPLHKACAQGSAGCVGFLLGLQEVSAKVSSAADMHGFTPLHLAVLHDHAPILRTLLQAGASPNVPNLASFTPFHLALMRSSPTILGMLTRESLPEFQGNAMCDALASELKLTMLHLACSAPSRDTMQFLYDLLPQYCAPNPRDAEDRTPLHYAFLFGRKDLIPLLLMHSADASLVDKAGNDATAKSPFPPEEVAELLSHGNSLKRTQVQKKWRAIAVTFNQSPKAGVEEGVTRNLMERTPLSIAQFLYECEHLKKEMIGEYIGDHKPFHIEVLDAYAGLFSFEGLPFDAALRLYLSKFRLPGEAQKIERCVERFARQFHAQNPGSFRHEDGAFILSYSTIMLNTDAHNPQVKNKMTKEQFVKTNRGIDDGQDIPQDFLERLYDSITGEAIKMDGEGELRLFQAAEKKGWMRKQGGRVKTWKRRWFVLSANCVYYFKFPEDKEPLGIIPLENLDVRPVNVKKCEFEIFSPQKLAQNTGSESAIKAVKSTSGKKGMEKGHHDRYLLSAATQEEMDAWIACIRSHIVGNPVYLLMQQRAKPKVASQPASSPLPTSAPPPDAAASSSSAAPPASHSTPTGTAVGTLPPDIAEFDISFREIHSAVLGWYHLQINSIDQLRQAFADWDVVFETSSPDISLAICTNHASRQQSVIFHRAAWDDIDVFAQVLHTAKAVDPRLYEIGKVSEHLVNSILSRHLKYDYALSLIGDGLGGCHAIEVWASIRKQLKVQPKIITFGQPLHSFNIPSKSLKTIPLVRFLTDVDPVVYLFSGVDPYGGEIILMKQGLFSVITRPSRPKVPASLTIERAKERAQAHIPREYLARVEQLLHKPTRVQVEK
ncbi:MAG: Sec7 domain-containing protein, partial [archaeon]|nr:Sec7 domain-containing protein [archaeon]